MVSEKKEKRVLWMSFVAGLLFAVAEFLFAIFSRSQSVLMDAVYDTSESIFIALILFLMPLFYKPVSEKHPYGFYQVESIFLIIKGFMMLSVTFGVSAEVIETALSGGNHVEEIQISLFQLVLGIASAIIFVVMKKMNHSLSSPTVEAELLEWKLDITYSLGLSAAFFAATFLKNTPLNFLTPYFDPVVAVVVALLMLPENIKMLWGAIKDIFLFSPDGKTVEDIKSICNDVLEKEKIFLVFLDVTRTGRHMWVDVYFETAEDYLTVRDVQRITEEINKEVGSVYENCTCELVLST